MRNNKLAAFLGVLVVILFLIGRDVFVWISQLHQMFPQSLGAMSVVPEHWITEDNIISTPFHLRLIYGIPFYFVGAAALIAVLLPFSRLQSAKVVALRVIVALFAVSTVNFLTGGLTSLLANILIDGSMLQFSPSLQLIFGVDRIVFAVTSAFFFAGLAVVLRQDKISLRNFKGVFLPVLLWSLAIAATLFLFESLTSYISVYYWEHAFAWQFMLFFSLIYMAVIFFVPTWFMATALNAHMLHEFDDENTLKQDGSHEEICDED